MTDYDKEKIKLSLFLFKSHHISRKGVIKIIKRFNDFLSLSFLSPKNDIVNDLEKDVDSTILDRIKL